MSASPIATERRRSRLEALYPYLLLSLCQLSWAGNWIIGRAVRDLMPPIALSFWRWTIAALALAPFALPRLRGKRAALRRGWGVLFLLGLTGVGFCQALVYAGLRYTEAVNATLMNSASPLIIMLTTWLLAGDRVTARQLAGMAVSFCGLLVILTRGAIGQLESFHFNPGDLLVLLSMPSWGVYCVLLRRRPRELDGISLMFIVTLGGLAVLAPSYLLESLFLRTPTLTWGGIGALLYLGLFASVFSYLCWNRAADIVGPNRAGYTNHLLPVFAALLAMLLLGEQLHAYHAVGIATILCGVWLATSSAARA